jgi:cytidine deaminase
MKKQAYTFSYEIYRGIEELTKADADLLLKAREVTENAYAPYSNFKVSAVALLNNGNILTGTNQENASYPVTICAERVLLSAISSVYGNEPINTLAVSYNSKSSNKPISPCGMCRQMLAEYEERTNQPIRIILSGMVGEVYIINSVTDLLPLSFSGTALK